MRYCPDLIALLLLVIFLATVPLDERPAHVRRAGGVEVSRTERTVTYRLSDGMLVTVSQVQVGPVWGLGERAEAARTTETPDTSTDCVEVSGIGGCTTNGTGGPGLGAVCAVSADCGTGGVCTSVATWTTPGQAYASDNTRANSAAITVQHAATTWLKCTNFGFALEPGQQVAGVQLDIEGFSGSSTTVGATGIRDQAIRLVLGGAIDGAAYDKAIRGTNWGTGINPESRMTRGGASDRWGHTAEQLYRDLVNASDFGVAISGRRNNATGTRYVNVDTITLSLYHYPPLGPVYISGLETYAPEADWGGAGITTADFPTTVCTGLTNRCLSLDTSAAGEQKEACAPRSFVDGDLTAEIDQKVAAVLTTDTIADTSGTKCVTMARIIQASRCSADVSKTCTTAADCGTGTCDEVTGCYLNVCRLGTDYVLSTYYAGLDTSHQQWGPVNVSVAQTTAGVTLGLGQLVDPANNTVACPLSVEGARLVGESYATPSNTDCSGLLCDIETACVGMPGASPGTNNTALGAPVLLDDWVITNSGQVGLGPVHGLYPTATGFYQEWTTTGSSSSCSGSAHPECVDDWTEGGSVDQWWSSGSTAGYINRSTVCTGTTTCEETYEITDPPALSSTERIIGVMVYGMGGNAGSAATSVTAMLRSNSQDAFYLYPQSWPTMGTTPTPQAFRGMWLNDPQVTPTGTPIPAPTWAPTRVQGLQAGVQKPAVGTSQQPQITALLSYVLFWQPAPEPDKNLQDFDRDGEITLCIGCDSISDSTQALVCTGGDCQISCTGQSGTGCGGDGDCTQPGEHCSLGICTLCPGTGAICNAGKCLQNCTSAADCDCAAGAACQSSGSVAAQIVREVPQIDNLFALGDSAKSITWWKSFFTAPPPTPNIVDRPYEAQSGTTCNSGVNLGQSCATDSNCPGGQCGYVRAALKGRWGKCPDGTSCVPPSTCVGGSACQPIGCDQVWSMCGGADALFSSQGWCYTQRGAAAVAPLNGQCPLAATTPGPMRGARVACTDVGRCVQPTPGVGFCSGANNLCRSSYGSDYLCSSAADTGISTCKKQQAGGQNCTQDADCSGSNTCLKSFDSRDVWCQSSAGVNSSRSACLGYCTGHDDPVWPCILNASIPVALNNCLGDATNCLTTTRYCTVPLDLTTCTKDGDCPSTLGGGSCYQGKCEGTANVLGSCNPNIDYEQDMHSIASVYERMGKGNFAPSRMMTDHEAIRVIVEDTYHRRYIPGTYMQHDQLGPYSFQTEPWTPVGGGYVNGVGPLTTFGEWFQSYSAHLRRWPAPMLDNEHYSWVATDRNDAIEVTGLGTDRCHITSAGTGWLGTTTAGLLESLFPVCSNAPTPCAGCLVSCGTDLDCNPHTPTRPPVSPGTNTPTPVATHTPVPNACVSPGVGEQGYCRCANATNCSTGVCTPVSLNIWPTGSPTPTPALYCTGATDPVQCAAGDLAVARRIVAADSLCSGGGTCSAEVSHPRCADAPQTRCVRDSDCPSGPCTTDAAFVACVSNADCRADGYHNADVCAGTCDAAVNMGAACGSGAVCTPRPTFTITPTFPAGSPSPTPSPFGGAIDPAASWQAPSCEARVCRQPTPT